MVAQANKLPLLYTVLARNHNCPHWMPAPRKSPEMPPLLRAITHLIPARYFASSLQTLYQAGNVLSILLVNAVCLLLLAAFWLTLTARKTRRTLE